MYCLLPLTPKEDFSEEKARWLSLLLPSGSLLCTYLRLLSDGWTQFKGLWMEEILHRFYHVDSLQPCTPFLTLALKASRSKFVPMTEILHRLRQNSCQCQKVGAGMRRHVIENAYYAGGARFPPSTVAS